MQYIFILADFLVNKIFLNIVTQSCEFHEIEVRLPQETLIGKWFICSLHTAREGASWTHTRERERER